MFTKHSLAPNIAFTATGYRDQMDHAMTNGSSDCYYNEMGIEYNSKDHNLNSNSIEHSASDASNGAIGIICKVTAIKL
jgi:hypothetical protein